MCLHNGNGFYLFDDFNLNCLDILKEVTQRVHRQRHKEQILYCCFLSTLHALHQHLLEK